MNIAYIVPSLKNAGPVLVVKDLVATMIIHNHQCIVFYFDNIKEVQFNCPTKRIQIRSKIDLEQYDIVHAHGYRPSLYVTLHKSLLNHKTIYLSTMHNFLFKDFTFTYGKRKGFIYGLLYLLCLIRFDKVIVLNKLAVTYYSKIISVKKLTYVYNSRICNSKIDLTDNERKELDTFRGDTRWLVGTTCRVSPIKGLDIIIQSLKWLPHVKFCIVGDGEYIDVLKSLAKQTGVADKVLFVGYKQDAYRYLRYFDIYTIPSYSEGFPLSLLEAANFGKATITSDIPVFQELFSDKEISMFHLCNIKSVVKAFETIIDNKTSFEKNIRDKYNNLYSPKQFYERHIKLYQELINK